jgi:hypothetical protein
LFVSSHSSSTNQETPHQRQRRLFREIIRNSTETLCQTLSPLGRRQYGEWRVGNTAGERGDSLSIRLTGDKAGLWHDWATGEGGDFIDLLRAKFGFGFKEAVDWIERTLGIDLQSPEPETEGAELAGEKGTAPMMGFSREAVR